MFVSFADVLIFCFFFFKQKTAYEMLIRYGSSDVCSSDLVADQLKTGANTPCWLVFDATFREKFSAGGIMPTILMPDRKIPPDWWDHYIFRADSLDALAAKIQVPVDTLAKTRSEERRVGKECVSTCISLWSPYHSKKKHKGRSKSTTSHRI